MHKQNNLSYYLQNKYKSPRYIMSPQHSTDHCLHDQSLSLQGSAIPSEIYKTEQIAGPTCEL